MEAESIAHRGFDARVRLLGGLLAPHGDLVRPRHQIDGVRLKRQRLPQRQTDRTN
jgi:hypothetical protein